MTSLYGQYIKERCGHGIIETDYGFATFSYPTSEIVFLMDVYIIPEKRNNNTATELAYRVCREAEQSGHKQILSCIDVTTKGYELSASIMEKKGATLFKVVEPMVYYIMSIEDLLSQSKENVIEAA